MLKRSLSLRLAGPTVVVSLVLVGFCIAVAVYLFRQQAATAEILGMRVAGREIDHDLETALNDLIARHRNGTNRVEALQGRIRTLLAEAKKLAAGDEEENSLVSQLEDSLGRYHQRWEARPAPGKAAEGDSVKAAVEVLETESLPICRRLLAYNTGEIEEAEAAHLQTVRWMAWGLAGVGTVGALAGIFLGYGVARGLRHSIHQLSIRVQDAAGKLGQRLPAVVLTSDGDLQQLDEQMHGLGREVERVVEKLRQREREVLRAEQLAAVGQVAAGVAHELRNPLTTIKMLVQTNREETQGRGLPADDLRIIEDEIVLMERCLQTFLDYARPPRPERRPLDVASVVERVFALTEGRARKQGVRLECTHPPTPVIVEADASQIQQLLVNLALNALDAMPRGGTLKVHLGGLVHGQVELRVQDTGPGIDPEILPRLFQPFVSSKEAGLGLGLAVSQRIAESHGASLWVTNPPDGGACFVLRLPLAGRRSAAG